MVQGPRHDSAKTPRHKVARTPHRRIYDAIKWATIHLSWAPPLIQALATVGAAILFIFGQTPEGDVSWPQVIWGGVLSLLSIATTVLIDTWRRHSQAGETAERIQLQVTLNDAVTPLSRELAKMSGQDAGGRARTLERIIGNVGSAIPAVLRVERLRVVVYQVQEAHGRRKRCLIPHKSVGRKDAPDKFVDGDGARGDEVFAWLGHGKPLFEPDITLSELPGVDKSGDGYKTFISVPLLANEKAYGMLTVDAPTPGDLDESDTAIIEVFASLLATAYAFSERA